MPVDLAQCGFVVKRDQARLAGAVGRTRLHGFRRLALPLSFGDLFRGGLRWCRQCLCGFQLCTGSQSCCKDQAERQVAPASVHLHSRPHCSSFVRPVSTCSCRLVIRHPHWSVPCSARSRSRPWFTDRKNACYSPPSPLSGRCSRGARDGNDAVEPVCGP